MKTIIVSTRKGGVGKTTLVLLMAWYFAEQKKRVLVIDLDGQANTSATLAAYGVPGVTALRLFQTEALTLPPTPDPSGGESITLIPANRELDNFKRKDSTQIGPPFRAKMTAIGRDYDVCLIDTPPSDSVCALTAMIVGDAVISPIDAEEYSIQGISQTLKDVRDIKTRNPALLFLGILPSRIDGRSQAQKTTVEQLVRDFGNLVLPYVIKESESISAMVRAKLPVWKLGTTSGREQGRAVKELLQAIDAKVFT